MAKEYIKTIIPAEYKKVVLNIKCNCCGKNLNKVLRCKDTIFTEDYLSISKNWGYFSEIFGDFNITNFDVCEECVKKWVDTFKIPVETENSLYKM